MSSANKRFLTAYILLVGLPLLGLVGVLKAGRRIAAPISVNGTWKLEIDDTELGSLPCRTAVTSLQHSAMAISQSGRQLAVNFGGESRMTGSGIINERALRLEVATARAAAESGCQGDGVLSIAATLDPNIASGMIGTISVNDCASCSPVKFRAETPAGPPRRQAY